MKKQDLLRLHGLLGQVADVYEQQTGTTATTPVYDDLGVDPMAIHRSKVDHKAAVFTLADELADTVEAAEPVADTAPAIGAEDYPTTVVAVVDDFVELYDRETVAAVVDELYAADVTIDAEMEEL